MMYFILFQNLLLVIDLYNKIISLNLHNFYKWQFFILDFNKGIGYGHLSRCSNIGLIY